MLPSQTGRSSSSRSHMYRRGRRKRVPIIIGTLTILLGTAVAFKWMGGSNDPSPANADVTPAVSPAVVEPPLSAAPKPKPSPDRTAQSPPTTPPKPQLTNQDAGAGRSIAVDPRASIAEKISMGGTVPPILSNPAPKTEPELPKTAPANTPTTTKATTPDLPQPSMPAANLSNSNTPAAQRLNAGLTLLAQNRPLDARRVLTSALLSPGLSNADAERARTELTRVNQRLVFSPEVVAGDPFASQYTIVSGDNLANLPRKLSLKVDWRFLQRINKITAPERIQVGQRIKVITGPFHAIVHKREFRMDIFMGDGDNRVYVRSCRVGLGEHGATPEGVFAVKPNSKLIDPAWTNPRTGEFFAAADPNNPLGEYWIGLIGASDNIRGLETYGIHGTVEPDSIGQLRSMGCVRMLHDDVALVYELLIENASRVEIHGDDFP